MIPTPPNEIGGRKRDAGAPLLEVRSAAEVIRMPVREQHVTNIVRVYARSAHLRQEHGFELVRITGVDQQNAGFLRRDT